MMGYFCFDDDSVKQLLTHILMEKDLLCFVFVFLFPILIDYNLNFCFFERKTTENKNSTETEQTDKAYTQSIPKFMEKKVNVKIIQIFGCFKEVFFHFGFKTCRQNTFK